MEWDKGIAGGNNGFTVVILKESKYPFHSGNSNIAEFPMGGRGACFIEPFVAVRNYLFKTVPAVLFQLLRQLQSKRVFRSRTDLQECSSGSDEWQY